VSLLIIFTAALLIFLAPAGLFKRTEYKTKEELAELHDQLKGSKQLH
jgi:hypothetical protein